MKAIVKYGQNDGNVEIRDILEPTIGADDVLLEVKAAGVCGWDIEMWRHKMAHPIPVPVVQGHEFSGVIAEVGKNVTDFREGDRVVSETAAVICGTCRECRTGNYNLCPNRKGFGVLVDGAFTKYVRVPGRCLHRIPDNVSYDHASLTEPVCVAYHALVRQTDINPGEPLLIIGPGPIGLFCLQVARLRGASPVIVVGTRVDGVRFEAARKLGADIVVDVSKDDPMQAVMDLTGGVGVPVVIDAAGNETALALSISAVARRGQITKIGWGPKPVNLSLDPLLSKSVRLQGTFSHTWPTWETALQLISRGQIDMETMISHRAALDEWHKTYTAVENCEAIKAVFVI